MKPRAFRGDRLTESRRHVLRNSILQFEQVSAGVHRGSLPDIDPVGADKLHADTIGVARLLDRAEQQIVDAERFGNDNGLGCVSLY